MVDDRQEEPQSRSRMVDGGFWRSCTGQPWGLRLLGFFQPNAPRLPISQSGCYQWGVEASLIHSAGIPPTTTKKIRKQGQSIFKMKISKVRRSYLKSTLTNKKTKLLKLSRTEEKNLSNSKENARSSVLKRHPSNARLKSRPPRFTNPGYLYLDPVYTGPLPSVFFLSITREQRK
jgi:hypothetical protein